MAGLLPRFGGWLLDTAGGLGQEAAKVVTGFGEGMQRVGQAVSNVAFGSDLTAQQPLGVRQEPVQPASQQVGGYDTTQTYKVGQPNPYGKGETVVTFPTAYNGTGAGDTSGSSGGSASASSGGTGAVGNGGATSFEPPKVPETPMVPPEKPLDYTPVTTPGGSDVEKAYTNPSTAGSTLVGNSFGATQTAANNVVDVRAAQPTNVTDLEKSRGVEGYNQARADLQDVTGQINKYNANVQAIETQVRNEYAQSNLTESEIQAEVTNRTRKMIPEGQRLQAAYNTAKANYDIAVDATAQQFNARRADAAEAVNAAMMNYGFKKEAAELGLTIMQGMKNFEVATDAQKDRKRDAARAYAVQAFSTPGMLQRMSPQAIAQLEADAQFYPGTVAGVRDAIADGKLIFGNVDDYGNFYYAKQRPDGSIVYGTREGLAKIAPKVSSASLAAEKSWKNASPQYKDYHNRLLAALLTAAEGKDSQTIQALYRDTALKLAVKAGETNSPADKADADLFMQSYLNSQGLTEFTPEKLQAGVQEVLDQQNGT